MYKILTKSKVSPINIMPGDTIELRYSELGKPDRFVRRDIEKYMVIDTLIIVELENELGLEVGIGGFFGKEKNGTGEN